MHSGIWGGKWCNSSFDPPAPAGAPPKPDCPKIQGAAVPAFQPVSLPGITSLTNGTITVTAGNQTIPLKFKVRNSLDSLSGHAACA